MKVRAVKCVDSVETEGKNELQPPREFRLQE